jgi:hypothetical protein
MHGCALRIWTPDAPWKREGGTACSHDYQPRRAENVPRCFHPEQRVHHLERVPSTHPLHPRRSPHLPVSRADQGSRPSGTVALTGPMTQTRSPTLVCPCPCTTDVFQKSQAAST